MTPACIAACAGRHAIHTHKQARKGCCCFDMHSLFSLVELISKLNFKLNGKEEGTSCAASIVEVQ
jgi:hypothetical protein